MNYLRHNEFTIHAASIYTELFNRFNGLDYLSLISVGVFDPLERMISAPLVFVPRFIWPEKPVFSQSLILGDALGLNLDGMLVSFTVLAPFGSLLSIAAVSGFVALMGRFIMSGSLFFVVFLYNLQFIAAFWEYDMLFLMTFGFTKIVVLYLSFILSFRVGTREVS